MKNKKASKNPETQKRYQARQLEPKQQCILCEKWRAESLFYLCSWGRSERPSVFCLPCREQNNPSYLINFVKEFDRRSIDNFQNAMPKEELVKKEQKEVEESSEEEDETIFISLKELKEKQQELDRVTHIEKFQSVLFAAIEQNKETQN